MARAMARVAPEVEGIVVAARESGASRRAGSGRERFAGIAVLRGEHPVPGRGSFAAASRIAGAVSRRSPNTCVLVLLSGGASSLLAMPAPGVSIPDKIRLGRVLLGAGLAIAETNAVRKHVSAIKGGGLLRLGAPSEVITLAISDVVGDDLATIGSAPAVPDPTTYADALAALEASAAAPAVPPAILAHLRRGRDAARRPGRSGTGRGPRETVKPTDPEARRAKGVVIGSNRTAVTGAVREAKALGYAVRRLVRPLTGEASRAAARFARALSRTPPEPACVIAGGETVVTAVGARGTGGRCQEFALALAPHVAGTDWQVLAAGTDGIDGRTRAGGAFCDGWTLARAGAAAISRDLAAHDSNGFFRRHGGLFSPGPSGTNALDVVIALHPGAGPSPTRARSRRTPEGRSNPSRGRSSQRGRGTSPPGRAT